MRKLFVHCGLPKTGTTSLQKCLAMSREELRSVGFDYPDIAVSADRTAHHNLARELLLDRQFVPDRGTVQDLLNYVDRVDRSENIVLSSEGLSNCLMRARPELLEFLRQMRARNDAVFVIFSFRKFWRMTESAYLYELKNGDGVDYRPEPFRPRGTRKWLRKLSEGLSEVREFVGDDKFVTCDLEGASGDSVSEFLRILGVTVQLRRNAESKFNSRVGLKRAALLYRLRYASKIGDDPAFLSQQQYFKARNRILEIPNFPGEVFDYRVVSYEEANAIQAMARDQLPAFLTARLEQSLQPEALHYPSVDLRSVPFSREELDAVRAVLPEAWWVRLPWLEQPELVVARSRAG